MGKRIPVHFELVCKECYSQAGLSGKEKRQHLQSSWMNGKELGMGFYYGDAWDGICEWVDGIGWVDPNEDREEEPVQVYRITYEYHDSRLIPQGGWDYIMSTSEQEAIKQWLEAHGEDWDSVWARPATKEEIDEWEKEIDEWVDDLPFD